jgi:hypothetical protein
VRPELLIVLTENGVLHPKQEAVLALSDFELKLDPVALPYRNQSRSYNSATAFFEAVASSERQGAKFKHESCHSRSDRDSNARWQETIAFLVTNMPYSRPERLAELIMLRPVS